MGYLDTTPKKLQNKIRFVDKMTAPELTKQFTLIKEGKSKLSNAAKSLVLSKVNFVLEQLKQIKNDEPITT